MTPRPHTRLSADDFWQLCQHQPDLRAELIEGELVEMSPAGGQHGEAGAYLCAAMVVYVRQHRLGRTVMAETGFRLDDGTVLAPDGAFIRAGRLAAMPVGFVPLAPDLAIEVMSPRDSAPYIADKVARYIAAGTRLVWVVYPDTRSVVVHTPDGTSRTLGANDTLDGADVLPGFTLVVADVFPPRGKPAAAPTTDAAADHDGGAA